MISATDTKAPIRIVGLSRDPAPTKICGPVQDPICADVMPEMAIVSWHTAQPSKERLAIDTSFWIPLKYECVYEGLVDKKNIHAHILNSIVSMLFQM